MGKFKEMFIEVSSNQGAVSNFKSLELVQPTFIGLIDIFRGLQAGDVGIEASRFTDHISEFFEPEEYNPNQLHLFGAEAV